MIFIDLILQTGKAAGIWASCLDPRQFFNDFLKTKKMCNVRTIILAAVSSHIEPYGPISDQFSYFLNKKSRSILIVNDFLKTKKMRNVRTIILAAVSSHIESYGSISD